MTILQQIVQQKQIEIATQSRVIPMEALQAHLSTSRQPNSLVRSLHLHGLAPIIAEFKRASPSKGPIHARAQVGEVTEGYVQAGAAGLSILTEQAYFDGSDDDLIEARALHPHMPILRKDFIISPYQIYQSAALGADVILLIARLLTFDQISQFTSLAHELGMEVLLELHDRSEIEKIDPSVDLIGINSRNLNTFEVLLPHVIDMKRYLPTSIPIIAESGIHSVDDGRMLLDEGFKGLLIGSYFMQAQNPGMRMTTFVQQLTT